MNQQMPDRDHLQPDSWDIVDHPNGWDLRWRPPVTRLLPGLPVFYGRLPKSLVTSQAFWSWYYGVFVAVLAIELYIRYGIRSPYVDCGPLFPRFARMIPSFDESFNQFVADLQSAAEEKS